MLQGEPARSAYRALQICHGWQVFQTHQPIEVGCTKKQPSYARLIGNDVACATYLPRTLTIYIGKHPFPDVILPQILTLFPINLLASSLVLHF